MYGKHQHLSLSFSPHEWNLILTYLIKPAQPVGISLVLYIKSAYISCINSCIIAMPDCSTSINDSFIEVAKLPASLSTEEHIQLTFTAINNGLSIQQLANFYKVSYSTLNCHLNDTVSYITQAAHQQKLTPEEKTILKHWALQQADWGFPAEIALFYCMVNHLLHQKLNNDEVLNKCWIKNFLKCHSALKSKYSNLFDKKWAFAENREIFFDWFNLFSHQMKLYNIQLKDLYNINEKGFLMRQSAKTYVVVFRHDKHAYSVQKGF